MFRKTSQFRESTRCTGTSTCLPMRFEGGPRAPPGLRCHLAVAAIHVTSYSSCVRPASGRKFARPWSITPTTPRWPSLVTERLGVRHVVLEQEPETSSTPRSARTTLSSFGVDNGSWPLLLSDFFANERIDSVYDGIGGDVLSAGLFLTPERDRLFRTVICQHHQRSVYRNRRTAEEASHPGMPIDDWSRELARSPDDRGCAGTPSTLITLSRPSSSGTERAERSP